ncbi:MAG TPA: Holliday junction branch migration protein RuvA [Anaerolineales bacterium]|nr:Holliday junction branch migration protein RuvA [Anaerolineales bacterium]
MISSLNGHITEKGPDYAIVEIGGVGLRVFIPAPSLDNFQAGEMAFLHTHLVVREDSLTLYGFETTEEREFFNLLLGVSGVGPRLALATLSTLNTDAIRRAVFSEQPEVFTRVPGIGKKSAQKILLHLQDRVQAMDGLEHVAALDDADTQTIDALVALGYSIVEAQTALQSIPRDAPKDVETRIRLALQYFST